MREYFLLGCKLFGIYCIVLSVPSLCAAFVTVFSPNRYGNDISTVLVVTKIAAWMIPFTYILGGLYLLKDGSWVYTWAYSNTEQTRTVSIEWFRLFLKMLGVLLMVSYFPDLLKSISSYIVYKNAPEVFNMLQEKQFTYLNILSSLGAIMCGLYLLKSGEVFIRMAFTNTDRKEKNEA